LKHVEESNILRINNSQCIKLVLMYSQFMMHVQKNIKIVSLFTKESRVNNGREVCSLRGRN